MAGRITNEHIFNLRIISEKYTEHQKTLYHVFIDFKKAFDRIWHVALWNAMKRFNVNAKLIKSIQGLYEKAISAIYSEGKVGEWFATKTGVRQGCLLSPILLNIMLEQIMNEDLLDHQSTIPIGRRTITNVKFADDIYGIAGVKVNSVI